MSWSRILGSATLLAFVLSLAVGGAESAIPHSTNKKYYACFSKKTGDVRLINYPKVKRCGKGWRRVSWNAKGIPGTQGPVGPAGPAGPAGITRIHLTTISSSVVYIPNNDLGHAVATCPAGKVVGGGFDISGDASIDIFLSRPISATEWQVSAWNLTGFTTGIYAYAVCMTTDPGAVIASKKSAYGPADTQAFKPGKKSKKKRR